MELLLVTPVHGTSFTASTNVLTDTFKSSTSKNTAVFYLKLLFDHLSQQLQVWQITQIKLTGTTNIDLPYTQSDAATSFILAGGLASGIYSIDVNNSFLIMSNSYIVTDILSYSPIYFTNQILSNALITFTSKLTSLSIYSVTLTNTLYSTIYSGTFTINTTEGTVKCSFAYALTIRDYTVTAKFSNQSLAFTKN